MYIQFETCINTLSTIQTDMEVKYLYIQTINDGKCMTLIDTSEPFLSLGYPQDLTGTEFAYLDRNMEVSPIITKSEFGLLSSGGVPIYKQFGKYWGYKFQYGDKNTFSYYNKNKVLLTK